MGMEMEYNDEVIAQIREGKSPMELDKEQQAPIDDRDKGNRVVHAGKYEKQAGKDGWVPLEDWIEQGKSEEDWVDAPEFVRRGELMDRIKSQSKALKGTDKRIADLEARLKAVTEHNAKIAKAEFEKAKKMLRKQKLDALEDNDHEAVMDIDDKLLELEASAKAAEEKEAAAEETTEGAQIVDPELPQALQDWLADDSSAWYRNDPILQAAADKLASQYASQHFDRTGDVNKQAWDELLEDVEDQLRKRFPGEFKTYDGEESEEEEVEDTPRKPVSRKRVSQVAEPGRAPARGSKARGKSKISINDLTPDERKAHDEFVYRSKIMTSEEYLEQLEAVRDL